MLEKILSIPLKDLWLANVFFCFYVDTRACEIGDEEIFLSGGIF